MAPIRVGKEGPPPTRQASLLSKRLCWQIIVSGLKMSFCFFLNCCCILKKKKKSWNLLAVVCSTFCVNPEKKKCFEERTLGGAEGYDHNSLGTPHPREELVN